ncbi:MAG TPA: glycosyltransferase, partial [Solirubrobacteraceae bacterium]|nr:glycosyltransferase [Solirubrobacteraceae bacterium]
QLAPDPDSPDDPALHSYRSGFWGLVELASSPPGAAVELYLRARLSSGASNTVHLGTIAVEDAPGPGPRPALTPSGAGPLVAICMATYNPPLELFQRQVESIRNQSHQNWICLISDDCSAPDRLKPIEGLLEGDPRFVLSRAERRQGFYLNFERALNLVPADADYVALADQDDRWYPEKLEVLLEQIGDRQLIYSDARIITPDGREVAPTYWGVRRNNHSDLLSLLLANSVTGAASLFRREVLDYALPFPPAQFAHYHDHWIGLTALALGGIEFVARPLYDYVQHRQAALGHAAATRVTSLRQRLGRVRDDPRERVRVARTRYFVDVMRLMAFASILQARCGSRMSGRERRKLAQWLSVQTSWAAMARLGWRAVRELAGPPETLGAEWELLQALAWRRMLSATAGRPPSSRWRLDALPPADLAPAPAPRSPPAVQAVRALGEKVAPLDLAPSDHAPTRVNILIPTIDLEHFFGGYIAKFNLARRLADRGARVRLITVDPVGPLPRAWRSTIESYSGLSGLFERVEIEFGRRTGRLEVSRSDAFVATTWWTAHIAQAALQSLGREGFVYLIQEYEPMTFPMGSYSALAEQSYRFAHFALFSSQLLEDYFRRHAIGVFEPGQPDPDSAAAVFQNAITPVAPPSAQELEGRRSRALLLYARPEPHAARNMFELAVLALAQVAEEGLFGEGWELHGIGGLGGSRRIGLAGGLDLELLPRTDQAGYARRLRDHDVGLALMCTPHPSLVPIEMASAGLLTVTNTFENKTADALRAISSNLIAHEPTVPGVVCGVREALAGAADTKRRLSGAQVVWSRDWNSSFDDQLLNRLETYLAARAGD